MLVAVAAGQPTYRLRIGVNEGSPPDGTEICTPFVLTVRLGRDILRVGIIAHGTIEAGPPGGPRGFSANGDQLRILFSRRPAEFVEVEVDDWRTLLRDIRSTYPKAGMILIKHALAPKSPELIEEMWRELVT